MSCQSLFLFYVAYGPLPIALLGPAADVSFICLDDPAKEFGLLRVVGHRGPDAPHHGPSGRLEDAQVAGGLVGADRLLGVDHHGQEQEPLAKGHVSIMEDGLDSDRERLPADPALPSPDVAVMLPVQAGLLSLAVWADRASGPAYLFQVLNGFFVGVEGVE